MKARTALLLIVALVLLANANILDNAFLNWDDNLLVSENARIQIEHLGDALRVFDPSDALAGRHLEFIPLRDLLYALLFYFFGLAPAAYHLLQILAHAAVCLLLFWCARPWVEEKAALIATALFAVHPVHVESIAWISSLKDPTFSAAVLGAVGCWDRSLSASGRRRLVLYLSALLLMIVALGFKQIAIALPALLLAPDLAFRRRKLLPTVLDKIPFGAIALAALPLFLAIGARNEVIIATGGTRFTGFLTMTTVYAQYLLELVAPFDLSPRYVVVPVLSAADPRFLASAIAILGLWAAAALLWRRTRLPGFAALWFTIALLPVMNIIPIPIERADRYLYLPSIGVAIAAGAGIARLLAQPNRALARGAAALASLTFCLWLGLSVSQNDVWQDDLELWSAVVKRAPEFDLGRSLLAGAYIARHRLPEAEEQLRAAIAVRPSSAGYHTELGLTLFYENKLEEAEAMLRRAIAIDPSLGATYNDLALVLADRGELAEARRASEQAIALQPDYAIAHRNLARICIRSEEVGCATEHLRTAVDTRPSEREWFLEWLRWLAASHQGALVFSYRERLERRFGADAELWEAFADALAGAGREQEAQEAKARAAKLRGPG